MKIFRSRTIPVEWSGGYPDFILLSDQDQHKLILIQLFKDKMIIYQAPQQDAEELAFYREEEAEIDNFGANSEKFQLRFEPTYLSRSQLTGSGYLLLPYDRELELTELHIIRIYDSVFNRVIKELTTPFLAFRREHDDSILFHIPYTKVSLKHPSLGFQKPKPLGEATIFVERENNIVDLPAQVYLIGRGVYECPELKDDDEVIAIKTGSYLRIDDKLIYEPGLTTDEAKQIINRILSV